MHDVENILNDQNHGAEEGTNVSRLFRVPFGTVVFRSVLCVVCALLPIRVLASIN